MFNETEFVKIKEKALENHVPIIMDDTLDAIKEILEAENPAKILEIGTAVGYSAICFAKYTNENCIIDTIEVDENRANEANINIKNVGLENRINVLVGNAVNILPAINKKYDIIFIDANKGKYPLFLEEAIRLTKKNSVIIADNILYKGYTLSDYNKHKQRTAVNSLREYLKQAMINEDLETEIIDVGDGITVTRVK